MPSFFFFFSPPVPDGTAPHCCIDNQVIICPTSCCAVNRRIEKVKKKKDLSCRKASQEQTNGLPPACQYDVGSDRFTLPVVTGPVVFTHTRWQAPLDDATSVLAARGDPKKYHCQYQAGTLVLHARRLLLAHRLRQSLCVTTVRFPAAFRAFEKPE